MQIRRNNSIQYLGLEDGKQVVGDAQVGRFQSFCHWLRFLVDIAPGAATNGWAGSYTDLRGLGAEPCGHPSRGHRCRGHGAGRGPVGRGPSTPWASVSIRQSKAEAGMWRTNSFVSTGKQFLLFNSVNMI